MAEVLPADFSNEHIVIYLEAGGPIDLDELQESLAALARIYRRQHPEAVGGPPAKLYVSRVSSGSIVLEIVPLLALLGMPIAFMDSVNIVREFTTWIGTKLRAVADAKLSSGNGLTTGEAKDLEAFVSPLTGRKGAELGVTHARFHKRETDGKSEREIVAECKFNEGEINRAKVNLQKVTAEAEAKEDAKRTKTVREVLMAFQQADKSPGKESGRTGDRVIISDVTDKPLPVYFPREATAIKRRILEQTENPFSKGYIVDVVVQYAGDDVPKVYSVIELHEIVDLD